MPPLLMGRQRPVRSILNASIQTNHNSDSRHVVVREVCNTAQTREVGRSRLLLFMLEFRRVTRRKNPLGEWVPAGLAPKPNVDHA